MKSSKGAKYLIVSVFDLGNQTKKRGVNTPLFYFITV